MRSSTKYAALDVYQATTVASVRDERGRVIARTVLPTETGALVEYFRAMRGTIHASFEEGTRAAARNRATGPPLQRASG